MGEEESKKVTDMNEKPKEGVEVRKEREDVEEEKAVILS